MLEAEVGLEAKVGGGFLGGVAVEFGAGHSGAMFFGAKSGGQGRQGKGKAGRGPVKPVGKMGGTGYQPVPLGNLPSGMEGRVRCSTNVLIAKGALTLPPGW